MKKIIFFDMDGTVNLSEKLIPGANEFFDYAFRNNIEFVFITNNSSNNVSSYIKKMNRLGIECYEKNFYTSTDTTISYLKQKNYKRINVLGTNDFVEELEKDFEVILNYESNQSLDAVVVGFDTELNYDKIKTTCSYLEDGYPFIATNPDLRCPIQGNRFIPDCGAICGMLTNATNKIPKYLGKPEPEMINFLIKKFNVDKKDVMVVGDRLYTDILSGINAGVDTVAVLTGETEMNEINSSIYKPTFVIDSIANLIDVLEGKVEKYE